MDTVLPPEAESATSATMMRPPPLSASTQAHHNTHRSLLPNREMNQSSRLCWGRRDNSARSTSPSWAAAHQNNTNTGEPAGIHNTRAQHHWQEAQRTSARGNARGNRVEESNGGTRSELAVHIVKCHAQQFLCRGGSKLEPLLGEAMGSEPSVNRFKRRRWAQRGEGCGCGIVLRRFCDRRAVSGLTRDALALWAAVVATAQWCHRPLG